jgi:hypothetical protein
LGKAGERAPKSPSARAEMPRLGTLEECPSSADVEMVEIDSGDVFAMREENFSELLDEINQKQRQPSMAGILLLASVVIGIVCLLSFGGAGWTGFLIAIPAFLLGGWWDSFRRTTVLFYDLDDQVEKAFEKVTSAVDNLIGCNQAWHIAAKGDIRDLTAWKRNAGAGSLVDRKTTKLTYSLPAVIKSNLTPPAIRVGRQTVYFFPDLALIEDGGRFGAVGYPNLNISREDSRFIEDGAVPRDAQVVGSTWKHPNKSGGPDRRFKDNRQIPICLYEAMLLFSHSGVNEMLQFSRTGVVRPFSQSLDGLPRQQISVSCKTK